jgi:hypothetical protein
VKIAAPEMEVRAFLEEVEMGRGAPGAVEAEGVVDPVVVHPVVVLVVVLIRLVVLLLLVVPFFLVALVPVQVLGVILITLLNNPLPKFQRSNTNTEIQRTASRSALLLNQRLRSTIQA